MTDAPQRIPPEISRETEFFWKAGAEGELRFQRCAACRTFIHPPAPRCPECLESELRVEAVSGRATLATYTVNHQQWQPGFPPPYVIAIVEIEEQPGLRLTTNLVHCEIDAIESGMPLQVLFEPCGDAWLPLFEPRRG